MSQTKKNIKELYKFTTFEDRCNYLAMPNSVGEETFGFDRYLNQKFYSTEEWKRVRRSVILRDNGCDLGDPSRPISGTIYIHHMNPITKEDIINRNPEIVNPDFLVCVSNSTHRAIHYGAEIIPSQPTERRPNDTAPWK